MAGRQWQGKDYKVTYSKNKNAGTAKITIKGIGNYKGSKTLTFKIKKGNNTAKITNKTVTVDDVEKKDVTVNPLKVKKANGKVTYVKTSGNSNFTINKKTGKVTVKKGTPAGSYTIKIKIKAAGDKNHKAKTKTVAVRIKVSEPDEEEPDEEKTEEPAKEQAETPAETQIVNGVEIPVIHTTEPRVLTDKELACMLWQDDLTESDYLSIGMTKWDAVDDEAKEKIKKEKE